MALTIIAVTCIHCGRRNRPDEQDAQIKATWGRVLGHCVCPECSLKQVAEPAAAVVKAAAAYRQEEQDETPRVWRGAKLHRLGLKLDQTIEDYDVRLKQVLGS